MPKPPNRRRWLGLCAVLIAEAMNLLDGTIVQVAGPRIHADLGGRISDVQWFSAAYTLPFAILLLTGGRLGDRAGRRRVFQLGVAGFVLTSTACALAPSAGLLIAFRIAQGATAAVIIPQTFGLIRAMFTGEEQGKALGTIGPVMGLAAVCGPIIGGALTHADLFGSSWRAAFLVNVPLGFLVLALSPLLLEDRAPRRPGLDPTGTALAALGTALIVYPLIQGDPHHRPLWIYPVMAAGILVLVGFALHQRYRSVARLRPLVETSLFHGRAFPAALVTSTVFFAAMNGVMLVIVLQMQIGYGADALEAGLTLVPWSVGLAIGSWLAASYLVPRYGFRVMYAGLAIQAAGFLGAIAACHGTAPTAFPHALLGGLAVAGLGIGFFTTPFFTAALKPVDPQETGSAAGLLNSVQQLGGTLGVAILGSTYLDGTGWHSVQNTLWVAIGLLAAAAVAAKVMMPPAQGPARITPTRPAPTPSPSPLVPPARQHRP